MKLNARILLLAHMVYLLPKHILLLAAFTQHHDTYIQINNICRPWRIPLLIPLALLLNWKPSSLRGAILVHPGPRLLIN
jgi:hypothetical protein